ncbi:hypothetical protein C7445_1012 [Alicyclobacillus sacchari]|uniref:Uncharacterized protein n=1 Tax=Alicyclobacillus sacchari TaxID=392010 RepID=A0A4V3HF20_9BACL|nr:hypothetical protein C7445_1012 [Alicyclobacillus sacchari]
MSQHHAQIQRAHAVHSLEMGVNSARDRLGCIIHGSHGYP